MSHPPKTRSGHLHIAILIFLHTECLIVFLFGLILIFITVIIIVNLSVIVDIRAIILVILSILFRKRVSMGSQQLLMQPETPAYS